MNRPVVTIFVSRQSFTEIASKLAANGGDGWLYTVLPIADRQEGKPWRWLTIGGVVLACV